MNTSLDMLSMTGSELTTEQLDEVDGGALLEMVILIAFVAGVAIVSYSVGYANGQRDARQGQ